MSDQHTTTPTAAPCRRCGRVDGYVNADSTRPSRIQGFCKACYSTLTNTMRRRGYPDLATADRLTPYTGTAGARASRQETAHRRALHRAWGVQAVRRDHAGPHITLARPIPFVPYPVEALPVDGREFAEEWHAAPPWQPAPWASDPARFVRSDEYDAAA